jgi:hypothetical protein
MTGAHERQLGLREGEAVLAAVLVTDDPARELPASRPRAELRAAVQALQPPSLSPVLKRISRFHERTLSPDGPAQPVPRAHVTASFSQVAERRHSASAFTGEPLGEQPVGQLVGCCADSLAALADSGIPGLRAWVFSLRGALPPGAWTVRLDGGVGMQTRAYATAADAAAQLTSACQSQAIVRDSAVAIVIGLDRGQLMRHGHGLFRVASVAAGTVCSDLYREAAYRGIGTTLVGGFSGQLVSEAVATRSSLPLAIQVFGAERSAERKVDAAIVVTHEPLEDRT